MLGKRTRPVIIAKLPDPPIMSGGRFAYPEAITSPKCSLEFRIVSPRSLKNSDPVSGVGLGIVAALEKSSGDVPLKIMGTGSNVTRSNPIPISGSSEAYTSSKKGNPQPRKLEASVEYMENYTCVTSRRPDKSFTKIYCDKGETGGGGGGGHERSGGRSDMRWKKNSGVFYESPPRIMETNRAFPALDFLSSCYLCRKKLHGKDIYMYRGEKAFCSPECRCRQIATDERKEKCGSEVSDVSSSPYSRDNLFFTGIIAA